MIYLTIFIELIIFFIIVAVHSFIPSVIIWILLNIFNMTGTLNFLSIWIIYSLIKLLIEFVED